MASLRQNHGSQNFAIEIYHNQKRAQCSLQVKSKDVAEAVCRKITKLEEADRLALTPEDVGLGEWVNRVRDNLPGLYNTLLNAGVIGAEGDELDGVINCEVTQCPPENLTQPEIQSATTEMSGVQRYYTLKQAAMKTGLKYGTLYDKTKTGELGYCKIGERIYVTEEDIKNFQDSFKRIPATKKK